MGGALVCAGKSCGGSGLVLGSENWRQAFCCVNCPLGGPCSRHCNPNKRYFVRNCRLCSTTHVLTPTPLDDVYIYAISLTKLPLVEVADSGRMSLVIYIVGVVPHFSTSVPSFVPARSMMTSR